MPKIVITYDEDGLATGDGKADILVDTFIDAISVEHTTSTASVIDAIRVAVVEKRIKPDDVIFIFKGEQIFVRSNGELSKWPIGFCDHQRNRMCLLLKNRGNKD